MTTKAPCRTTTITIACIVLAASFDARAAPVPGGTLDPALIPKYVTPLVVPPVMPRSESDVFVDYQIAVREFRQQVLPPGFPMTTVWSYGSIDHPGTASEGGSFHYPAFTIEATHGTPVTVKWINDLKDPDTGNHLPHLLPVDQTLHWANPVRRCADGSSSTDCRGFVPGAYRGPVPIVTHVHGAHVDPESDGHPEAWYLPDARNLPRGLATRGKEYAQIAGAPDVPGQAIFRYRNDQPATTLWYHDHTLGITRLNVYAGPAGFYLLRGGPGDIVTDSAGGPAALPGAGASPSAPILEIPIAIQDRSFDRDGSLFYAPSRSFFDGFTGPFIPASDISRLWNPEFFGNTIVVNGRTWPFLEVEQRRYRLRLLNGSDSRFLILTTSGAALTFWQIGADGGFLPHPVAASELLLAPAERADVIVDFSSFPAGTSITLLNVGPDEPFGGGTPAVSFPVSDPETTGQVMQFRVVAATSPDTTTPPAELILPAPAAIGPPTRVRRVSLNELDSETVCLGEHERPIPCSSPMAVDPFGPASARLGTLDPEGFPVPKEWMDPITEDPALGSTEVWEIHNFTADAHPIHIHLVQFEVVDRQLLAADGEGMAVAPGTLVGEPLPPEPWETGRKDTVIVYPGQVTRVKAHYDVVGLFVWHCHILSHEDNEMMRPLRIVP